VWRHVLIITHARPGRVYPTTLVRKSRQLNADDAASVLGYTECRECCSFPALAFPALSSWRTCWWLPFESDMRSNAACDSQWSVEKLRGDVDRVSFVTSKGSQQTLKLLRADSTYRECVYRS
jgi:hypothetical protein